MKQDCKIAKCVVWDLDNTIWEGKLMEGDTLKLKDGIQNILKTLDQRGILQSVASKNEHNLAMEKLKSFNLEHYFLKPQINWNAKSKSIKEIASNLNIGIDTMVFIDDQEFEREEVAFHLPDVRCVNGTNLEGLLNFDYLNPKFITEDSSLRRELYQDDFKRNKLANNFKGTNSDFLASLEMKLELFLAKEYDLQRAVELTERTNQLNSTGITFSYEQLKSYSLSEDYLLLMARLHDKFGTYGHIGLILIEKKKDIWLIKLFLMSCRVISRGIGTFLLGLLINEARRRNVELKANFKPTPKNRMMNITYRLNGFIEENKVNGIETLKHSLCENVILPNYIELTSKKCF